MANKEMRGLPRSRTFLAAIRPYLRRTGVLNGSRCCCLGRDDWCCGTVLQHQAKVLMEKCTSPRLSPACFPSRQIIPAAERAETTDERRIIKQGQAINKRW